MPETIYYHYAISNTITILDQGYKTSPKSTFHKKLKERDHAEAYARAHHIGVNNVFCIITRLSKEQYLEGLSYGNRNFNRR